MAGSSLCIIAREREGVSMSWNEIHSVLLMEYKGCEDHDSLVFGEEGHKSFLCGMDLHGWGC